MVIHEIRIMSLQQTSLIWLPRVGGLLFIQHTVYIEFCLRNLRSIQLIPLFLFILFIFGFQMIVFHFN